MAARHSSDYILVGGDNSGPIQSYCYSFLSGGKFYCYKSGRLWRLEGMGKFGIFKAETIAYLYSFSKPLYLNRYIFSEEEYNQMETSLNVIVRYGSTLYQCKANPPRRQPLRWVRSSLTEIVLDTIHSNG